MKRLVVSMVVFSLFLAACASQPGGLPTEVAVTDPSPTEPVSTPAPADQPAVQAAIEALAAALGLRVEDITLLSAEPVEWPDSCLGIARPEMSCMVGDVPGFRVMLEANGKAYEYRTNEDGSVLYSTEPLPAPGSQDAVAAAMQALAQALGLRVEDIKLVRVETVEWPDSCLGIVRPDVLCAQGIVPGFLIVLEAQGQQYNYHTNADGTALATPGEIAPAGSEAAVEAARQALAALLGIALDQIGVVRTEAMEWPDACLGVHEPGVGCAEVITPGFRVVLEANGKQYDYRTNQDGSVVRPGTLVLTWQREGGIAGFCDGLAIFAGGQAHAATCQPGSGQPAAELLSAEDLAQLEAWRAQFGQVSVTLQDPAVADQMTVTLSLFGSGTAEPDEAAEREMVEWAQRVFTEISG